MLDRVRTRLEIPVLFIKDRCIRGRERISRDVDIRTSNEHALVDPKDDRMLNAPSSVHVEPDVWLGDKSTLLKGVHVR